MRRAAVVVVGDLGRSPRMLYHALSLAAAGVAVDLVGQRESPLPDEVVESDAIRVHALGTPRSRGGGALAGAGRVARDAVRLGDVLGRRIAPPDRILVQTPPSAPLLPVAAAAARRHGARLVVDWHNLGAPLLALGLGAAHPAVRALAAFERRAGRLAAAHLCVSDAMADALAPHLGGAPLRVLHDRPVAALGPVAPACRDAARTRLAGALGLGPDAAARPWIVCPTSYSADEALEIAVEAAARAASTGDVPAARILLTGRGPRRAAIERRIASLPPSPLSLHTGWLPMADYRRLLGCAELGLCLHRSASGLDLPMKIADMFGAALPVCALDDGGCLRERLRPGESGLLFRSPAEWLGQLATLLAGHPAPTALRAQLAAGAGAAGRERWEAAWERIAAPLLLG